jgi:hypothetical protein
MSVKLKHPVIIEKNNYITYIIYITNSKLLNTIIHYVVY